MKTLKVEAVYLMAYESFEDVAADLPRFIDQVCNTRRLLGRRRESPTGPYNPPKTDVMPPVARS